MLYTLTLTLTLTSFHVLPKHEFISVLNAANTKPRSSFASFVKSLFVRTIYPVSAQFALLPCLSRTTAPSSCRFQRALRSKLTHVCVHHRGVAPNLDYTRLDKQQRDTDRLCQSVLVSPFAFLAQSILLLLLVFSSLLLFLSPPSLLLILISPRSYLRKLLVINEERTLPRQSILFVQTKS